MPRVNPEFKSKAIIEQANALKDLRYKHLGQQVTFLETALRKVEGGGSTRLTEKRAKSIRRIVGKLLKGQGIEHPAVDLLLEREPQPQSRPFTTNESAAATEQD